MAPLQLDVSFPSLKGINGVYCLARLIFLFNIQLEKNVATFFIVLLVSCYSFVMIGGVLFFKFSWGLWFWGLWFWRQCPLALSLLASIIICETGFGLLSFFWITIFLRKVLKQGKRNLVNMHVRPINRPIRAKSIPIRPISYRVANGLIHLKVDNC